MNEAEFKVIVEDLTAKQRKVLHRFLRGETDEAIAAALYLETSTIRRHIANIGKAFQLNNEAGMHYSYREDLIELFARFQPEMVSPDVLRGGLLPNPEFPGSPLALDSVFYIEPAPITDQCKREISKPGALIRIRAPQRMGKTSLLNRILAAAETHTLEFASGRSPCTAISGWLSAMVLPEFSSPVGSVSQTRGLLGWGTIWQLE